MKNTAGSSIRLGIFVITTIALFVAGIYFIGQKQRLFSRAFQLHTIFADVSGLQVGNNVRFSGITIGTVEGIEIISDTTVRVDMLIDEDTRKFIKKDAKAIIGSEGLMGNKVINITLGGNTDKIVGHQDYIVSIPPLNTDEIFNSLKTTTENAANITSDLAALMHSLRSGKGPLGKFFMDSSLARNIDQTIVNLKEGTKGFEENMDAAKHSFILRSGIKKQKKEREKALQEEEDKQKEDKK